MYRLIYKSRASEKLEWSTVEDILHVSAENNAKSAITGFLLASQTHFLQIIEGTFEEVNETFQRITRDPRHHEIRILSYEIIDARLFEFWSMKGLGLLDTNTALTKQLIRKYGEEEGGVRFPLESWLALAMIFDIRAIEDLPEWKR